MANVIRQIVCGSGDTQTINMIVRNNERGAQGAQGEPRSQLPNAALYTKEPGIHGEFRAEAKKG